MKKRKMVRKQRWVISYPVFHESCVFFYDEWRDFQIGYMINILDDPGCVRHKNVSATFNPFIQYGYEVASDFKLFKSYEERYVFVDKYRNPDENGLMGYYSNLNWVESPNQPKWWEEEID